jgi:chromosome segregation ATPase
MSWFSKSTDHYAQILALEKRIELLEKEAPSNTSNHNQLENRVILAEENVKTFSADIAKNLLDIQEKVTNNNYVADNLKALDSQITSTFSTLTDSIQSLERKMNKMEDEFHNNAEHLEEKQNEKVEQQEQKRKALEDKLAELVEKINEMEEKEKAKANAKPKFQVQQPKAKAQE